jgi:hypothetical protein
MATHTGVPKVSKGVTAMGGCGGLAWRDLSRSSLFLLRLSLGPRWPASTRAARQQRPLSSLNRACQGTVVHILR